ncbi:multidrug transporter MATE [Pseudoponticoccus marisrubri]|uniref:Multidrug transporter MATE n=1 Tax=Pseudoponticoccus marisrubri TaxID=1685382 RepID=A0A0W7WF90_9RHOB|nr:multidrug transporter MATE [Pseudoponticoccus marisrubri]
MGHVVRMTLTSAAGITFVFLVDAANLFWLSQLGQPILMAAIGFAFAIQFFTVSIGVGLMIATTALVSRSIGRGERALARDQGSAGMVLTVLVQILTASAVVLLREPLLRSVGAEGAALELAARYLALSIPSLAVMAVGLCGSAVLRAEGDGRRAMQVTLGAGAVMLVLDPVLIVWLGLGLDGAALSVWIFRLLMAGLALHYAIGVHDLLARPRLAALRHAAGPLLRVALPAMVTQMATPFGNFLLTGVIATHGDGAVAAWAVINRLTVVVFGGLISLGGAIGGIFGQNYGAGAMDRVRSTYRDAVGFAMVYATLAWLVLMALADRVAAAFGLAGEAAEVLAAFAQVGTAAFILGGLIFVSNAAFNALGRPVSASLLSWTREGVLMLPAALWLSGPFGAAGVVYAQALVGVVMGVIAGLLGWRHVQRLDPRPVAPLDLVTRRAYRDVNRYRRR